ncbi:PREDICTED: F-box/kelch-repeat protein At5g42350 isoform X2 [Camelina sativa]|uniref:F-box/kelch-repeat protein At5g42350 isoform X1 n=1 Tax=Camelina sativa TaxID=90675 RepID=A0ABM0UJR2_CAMSA|nr:PREDICTED: F-box/kelch-repeat protein At5g42350 isoform X1 [Camelina sativa]XP_019088706.1 PREDICTED: F-box/kelch-repeat protein At5g42350 isoform X2 [Camelina sativa]
MMISGKPLGEESIRQDLEVLTVSKRLVKSVSQKLKKKVHKSEEVVEDEVDARGGVNCLSISVGCRVADTGEDFEDPCNKRWSSASEEGKGLMTSCGTEETRLDCFSYGVKERFWKKNNRRYLLDSAQDNRKNIFLPDDILEMCLMRLPLTSLMNAHLVCKKWRSMATTQRFLQMRREGSFQTPWLFLFAAHKDGCSSGEIHGYDVSQDKWHKIDSELLKGRYMYSVTSIHEEIYIIGGRSMDRNSFKSHRGILVFSPSTKSWRKIASMRHARSLPIVGASEVTSEFSTIQTQQNRQDRRFHLSRVGGESDVYEDPHRLSVRRQHRNSADQNGTKSLRLARQKLDRLNQNSSKRFVLISIGGTGLFDEPLDSGEIYDSATNTWSEIQRLPIGFGVVCCGIICNGIFYAYSDNDKLSGYDIERGFWIAIQTSPIPPRVHEFYPKLVSCNQRLFMLSVSWCDEGDGQIGRRNKAVRKLWELDLVYLTWTEVSVHPDAPMDWNATYASDKNILMGVEMFKIFGQVLGFFTVCDTLTEEASWRHVSRNQRSQKLNLSCMNKTIALLHL